MSNLVGILKRNWLVVVLAAVILVLLSQLTTSRMNQRGVTSAPSLGMVRDSKSIATGVMPPVFQESAPVESTDRLVVRNTNLSLAVEDVRTVIDAIVGKAEKLGGFLVDSGLNVQDGVATGQVSVRIPADKLREGLGEIRALGVKVVSENVTGTDVTSEYADLTARLETLTKTKAKFDQILNSATAINDILNVQREIVNLQAQIDSVRGQQKYFEQTAKLSLVTVYLATDELALPYTPDEAWRPVVVFREAVRSLIRSVRGLGIAVIWVVVYAPVWLPLLLLAWWLRRRAQ